MMDYYIPYVEDAESSWNCRFGNIEMLGESEVIGLGFDRAFACYWALKQTVEIS